ncbi:MAG: restriction endonuclease [Gammaproteobacteria bacterium]|nr:restriction endonuclease [Gammaproteobacteria bacterium]
MKVPLDIDSLLTEAERFAGRESCHEEPNLFGVTDGKAVGTYLEHKFQHLLDARYSFTVGSSAKGIDFPELRVDMKVTSIKQPQSSSPFESARQKVRGLGYSLLIFVYEKLDNEKARTSRLNILHTIFVEDSRTGDYQTTRGIREIIERDGNEEDIVSFMRDRNLPIDDSEAIALAVDLLKNPPQQGFLTISNALQWRLQYGRVISEAGMIEGVVRVS